MSYETILYETDTGKARITLNRPEKLNAISIQMQQELRDALLAADRDPAVHVAIIRGAGRTFSAGYDISPPAGEGQTHAAAGHSLERDIWGLEQSLEMRKKVLGDRHPLVAKTMQRYAGMLRKMGREQQALSLEAQAKTINDAAAAAAPNR